MDQIIITSNPNLCPVMEQNGLNIDVTARCLIKLEYCINDRNLFENIFGVEIETANSALKERLKEEIDSELVVILAQMSAGGIGGRQLEQSGDEISKKLSEYLPDKWEASYGVGLSIIAVKMVVQGNPVEMKDGPGMAFDPNDDPILREMSKYREDLLAKIATGQNPSVQDPKETESLISDKPQTKHRFCMNCGAKLMENAKFCMECGTKVEK